MTWTPNGGATKTLTVKSMQGGENGTLIDTTNTTDNGIQGLIPGVLRGDWTITAGLDGAFPPNNAAIGIRFGAGGVLTVTVGSATPWSVPGRVKEIKNSWEVDGETMYEFVVSLSNDQGAMVRPT